MNIKCNVIVDAWLGQILVTGLFTQTMPAIKLYPVQVLCQKKSAHRGDKGSVINEDIMVFQEQDFFIQSSPVAFEGLP